jgi:uncharacterized protein
VKLILRIIVILSISCTILYCINLAYLYFNQTNLVFQPRTEVIVSPEKLELDYEVITFSTKDNLKLDGLFVSVPEAKNVLLYCHGNYGNISNCLEHIKALTQLGLNIFIFDYRGFGKSEGKITENGTYLDVASAWDYLVKIRNIKSENIIVFGHSLGGAVAAKLAAEKNIKALVIEGSFTSIKKLAAELHPFIPMKRFFKFNYDTATNLRKVKEPVLIFHSRDDDVIPFHHGQTLYSIANEPKYFQETKGDHSNGYITSRIEYFDSFRKFLTKI